LSGKINCFFDIHRSIVQSLHLVVQVLSYRNILSFFYLGLYTMRNMNWAIGLVSTTLSVVAGFVFGFAVLKIDPPLNPFQDTNSSPQVLATVVEASPTPDPSSSPSPTATPDTKPTPAPIATPSPIPKLAVTPAPSPLRAAAGEMDTWFNEFAASESVSVELLRKIAVCESGYNQFSRNGIYGGMFQFSSSTWQSTRRAMNVDPNPDLRFDAREAIRSAAFRLATLGSAAWPNCD
jgi:hypothetical protein